MRDSDLPLPWYGSSHEKNREVKDIMISFTSLKAVFILEILVFKLSIMVRIGDTNDIGVNEASNC